MNTYAMKCPKCKKWKAVTTADLWKYVFFCYDCNIRVIAKNKDYGFNLEIKELVGSYPEKVIKALNELGIQKRISEYSGFKSASLNAKC